MQYPDKTRSSPIKDYMKVDVYSYAVLVWHIFTRQLPYGGRRIPLGEICEMLQNGTVSVRSWPSVSGGSQSNCSAYM